MNLAPEPCTDDTSLPTAATAASPTAATTGVREIHVSAARILDASGRILLVRKAGTTAFMQPGGKPELGETPVQTLVRELHEELGLRIDPDAAEPLGRYRAAAANEAGFAVVADVFRVDIGDQEPLIDAEIEELRWVTRAEASDIEVAPLAATYFLPER